MSPGHLMIIGTAAFLVAVLATPAIRRAALGLGMVDRPAERKLHSKPVPLLGGVAIYGAVIGSLLLFPERKGVGTAHRDRAGGELDLVLGAVGRPIRPAPDRQAPRSGRGRRHSHRRRCPGRAAGSPTGRTSR